MVKHNRLSRFYINRAKQIFNIRFKNSLKCPMCFVIIIAILKLNNNQKTIYLIMSEIYILVVKLIKSTSNNHKSILFLGYKKICESAKPTASSFSFGKRHTHNSKYSTDGPGPAEYDISGLGIKGIIYYEIYIDA